MKYKIYIIEDKEETFELYTGKINDLLKVGNLGFDFEVVSTEPTTMFDQLDFKIDLQQKQPDIIFLDYELTWMVRSESQKSFKGGTAVEVIKDIIWAINPLNFPPIIIMNTQNELNRQKIYDAFNNSGTRHDFPLSFLKTLTPRTIMDEPTELANTLNTSVKQLVEIREVSDVWRNNTDFSFYTWPDAMELTTKTSSIKFQDVAEKVQWWNIKEGIAPPMLSNQNFLFITYQTDFGYDKKTKKGVRKRLGSIFCTNNNNDIEVTLFHFENITTIKSILESGLGNIMGEVGNIIYNPRYFTKNRKLIKFTNETMKTSLIRFVGKELGIYRCRLQDHPVFWHFYGHISEIA